MERRIVFLQITEVKVNVFVVHQKHFSEIAFYQLTLSWTVSAFFTFCRGWLWMKHWNVNMNVWNKLNHRHQHLVSSECASLTQYQTTGKRLFFFWKHIFLCLWCWIRLWAAGWKESKLLFWAVWVGGTAKAQCLLFRRSTHLLLTWVRISSWPMMWSRVRAKAGGTPPSEAWDCAWAWGECCGKPWACGWWVEQELLLRCL